MIKLGYKTIKKLMRASMENHELQISKNAILFLQNYSTKSIQKISELANQIRIKENNLVSIERLKRKRINKHHIQKAIFEFTLNQIEKNLKNQANQVFEVIFEGKDNGERNEQDNRKNMDGDVS